MKRTIIWILAIVMLLGLWGCSTQRTSEKDANNGAGTSTEGQPAEKETTGQSSTAKLTVDTVLAAPETDANVFSYEITDEGVIIDGYEGTGGIVVVPQQIEGVKVVSIDNKAFANANTVVAVKLPDTVREVGREAFINCTAMELFISGAGVTHLGEYAFNACTKLHTVILSDVLEVIDDMCFASTALTEIELPSTLTTIGNAFRGESAETPITIIGESGSVAEQYVEEKGNSFHLVFQVK